MKKLLSLILAIAMAVSMLPMVQKKNNVVAAETFTIIYPADNALLGAGYFDIEWSDAGNGVKQYKVYIDDELIGTTKDTEFEYYTTNVKMYTVSIVAEDANGNIRESEEVSFGITKKGLCVNETMGRYLEPVDMNAGWYYNWSPTPFNNRAYKDVSFVPMIWGISGDGSIPTVAREGYKYLLGYNEPDMGFSVGGSDTSVETVVEHWDNFQGYDFYLGSPAPALCPSWDNGIWFRTFMDSIDHDTVDFIPLHCYYGYTPEWRAVDAAYTFLYEVVDKSYEMYGKPIWITEFAFNGCGYSNEEGRQYVKEFMGIVLKGLDERNYVERYSWFSFNSTDEANGVSALWTEETGELTELGKFYVTCGVPKGYSASEPEDLGYTVTETTRSTLLPDAVTIDNVVYDDYINVNGVKATASSEIDGTNIAMKAIDNSISSRWESVQGIDPQSITIDLGQIRSLKQFDIIWEAASARDYTIEVSEDGINYNAVANVEYGSGAQNRYDSVVFKDMVKGRYVKINGSARTTVYGYSIYDMAFYGTEVAQNKTNVEIVGYQYSTAKNGFRVITAIEPEINGKKVVECGNIYGIARDGITKEDIVLEKEGKNIKKFVSTSKGLSPANHSKSDTADSYVMTMTNNGYTVDAFTQGYMVRAYAKMADGSVIYSDVDEFSIYDIADYLYKNQKMTTADKHNYLYTNILSVVDKNYSKVQFDYNNSLAKIN